MLLTCFVRLQSGVLDVAARTEAIDWILKCALIFLLYCENINWSRDGRNPAFTTNALELPSTSTHHWNQIKSVKVVASDFCLPCLRHLHIIIASMGIEVYKYTIFQDLFLLPCLML
ncbi:hypothetical protein P8452_09113 [Trifolium repens]|nr:hypothetical protein P8452_09113 [Trifolium repens]